MSLLTEMKEHQFPIHASETHVKCRVFEDNCRCIEIATNHKMGVHTKYISVWLHHFHSHVVKKTITITRSNMKQQLAYIFTKPLAKVPFEYWHNEVVHEEPA